MIARLVRLAVFGVVFYEIVGDAILEGLAWLARRTGLLVWWLLTLAAVGGALAWWRADPASDLRTRVLCLSWVLLPIVGVAVSVRRDPARPGPDLLLRAGVAAQPAAAGAVKPDTFSRAG
jgi:hypothetical protein